MPEPLVTVVIPTFNRAALISRALESLQAQTHTSWEAIVVDDGSRDDTPAIVARLGAADSRIVLERHARNLGAQAARNTGIAAARGAWVTFLDADDYYLPDSIRLRLEAAISQRVPVVHSEGLVLRGDGEPVPFGASQLSGNVYAELLSRSAMLFPTLLVSRDVIARVGALDEGIASFQEWDLAIRLGRHHRFAFVDQATFVYDCRHQDSISKSSLRTARGYEQIVRKHSWEIVRSCGLRTLAAHYRTAAGFYGAAASQPDALRCRLLGAAIWPPYALRRAGTRLRRSFARPS